MHDCIVDTDIARCGALKQTFTFSVPRAEVIKHQAARLSIHKSMTSVPRSLQRADRPAYLSNRLANAGDRCCAKVGLSLGARYGKCPADAFGFEVSGVHWYGGLLTSRLVKQAGIDAIKSEFVEEPDGLRLVRLIVTSDRQCDAAGRVPVCPHQEDCASARC
ncbi:hypothetical protein [Paraburkholderia rhynchosiae]|uniref:hypothetical protein n=1 Tax=Paraburkholderia rhynchosiae TaxID=487049 RepID=UPI001FC9882D|nr:hypothetical protein [Paraburkholderia rhynchosiae]